MSKGACFGKCPIYKIEIYEGGYTKYFGERYSDKLGTYEKQLDQDTYNTLIKAFDNSDFYNYKDFYESNIPDAPTIKMTYINKKQEEKTIVGKLDRPDELKDLQVLIEDIASSKEWTLLEKLEEEPVEERDESAKPKLIKTEIIIEPKPGIPLSKWFNEKKELYGVRIINKVAPNLNLWLITYDKKMIDGDMLMQILHDDPSILSAEFNKKTSQRTDR